VTAAELLAFLARELPADPDDLRGWPWRPEWRPVRLPRCLAESKYGHEEHGARFMVNNVSVYVRAPHRSVGVVYSVTDPGGVAVIEPTKDGDVVHLLRLDDFVDPTTRQIRAGWVDVVRDAVRLAYSMRRSSHGPVWAKQ